MIPYMRMRVPLAGEHQIFPPPTDTGGEQKISEKMPLSETKNPIPPPVTVQNVHPLAQPPKPQQSVPPPPIGGGMKRLILSIAGIVLLLIIIFLAIRIVPGFFSKPTNAALTYWGLWEDDNIITG